MTVNASSPGSSDSKQDVVFKRLLHQYTRKVEDLQQTKQVLKGKKKFPEGNASIMDIAYTLLGDMIDECTLDICYSVHKEYKLASTVCQLCQNKCRDYLFIPTRPGYDVWGNDPTANTQETFCCVNCKRYLPAARYSTHLEKCLGFASRSSHRVAGRKTGLSVEPGRGSSPYTPASYQEVSDTGNESSTTDKKRKATKESPAKVVKKKKE
ncbi:Ataxin-7-like protein 3 [Basidiobolus ranarum]|uniref:SAGA-associated factor 11 n=2 Tax=Basidiobolus ranarum TaxID=34480 RepID=A0ABR2X433_9FUNG